MLTIIILHIYYSIIVMISMHAYTRIVIMLPIIFVHAFDHIIVVVSIILMHTYAPFIIMLPAINMHAYAPIILLVSLQTFIWHLTPGQVLIRIEYSLLYLPKLLYEYQTRELVVISPTHTHTHTHITALHGYQYCRLHTLDMISIIGKVCYFVIGLLKLLHNVLLWRTSLIENIQLLMDNTLFCNRLVVLVSTFNPLPLSVLIWWQRVEIWILY